MTRFHPILLPCAQSGQSKPPVTQGTVESGWGENTTEHRALQRPMFHKTDVVQLYMNAPNCHRHQNGVHVDICNADPPCSWLHCTTMFDCLCPQRQGRATINAKTLILYLLKFTKSSGDGGLYCTRTDRQTHKQTQAHAGEGESAF